MGRTLQTANMLLRGELSSYQKFRRGLRKADQLVFDELWAGALNHQMAISVADHALPFEVALFAMLLETRKEMKSLNQRLEAVERRSAPPK